MTIVDVLGHPGYQLEAGAAASLARWEARYGWLPLNDAWRSEATQLELIRRWNEGGIFNRPPYLYKPGWPSPHQSGLAIDTSAYGRFGATAGEYGWSFPIPSDPVHAVYDESADQHRNETDWLDTVDEQTLRKIIREETLQALYAGNPHSGDGKSAMSQIGTAISNGDERVINQVSHNVGSKLDTDVIPKL